MQEHLLTFITLKQKKTHFKSITMNLWILVKHFWSWRLKGSCQEKPVTQDWADSPSPPHPCHRFLLRTCSMAAPLVETWKYQEVLAALQSSVVYSVDMKEYFALIADIEFQRSARRIRVDQNGKIIEEIITSFTLQITLTRSSSKNHMDWENSSTHIRSWRNLYCSISLRQRKTFELFWNTSPGLLKNRL